MRIMKKIFALISIILLACCASFAQKVVYVIDDITVDNFDGTQLKGKTIRDYKISGTGKGKNAVTVHSIRTVNIYKVSYAGESLAVEVEPYGYPNMTYIIDGKKYSYKEGVEHLRKVLGSSERTMKSVRTEKKENPDKNGPKILHTTIIETQPNKKVLNRSDFNSILTIIPGAKTETDGSVTIDGKRVNHITINGIRYSVKKDD